MVSSSESNTNFVKEVHTSANGRRHYFPNNDKTKKLIYLCIGKDDTCTNKALKGGICRACGATPPRCKGFTEERDPCPNNAIRGGFCRTHEENPPVCKGVKVDGLPCTNRVTSAGGLCETHGRRRSSCPCGKRQSDCPKCNHLSHRVSLIRMTLTRYTRRYIRGKPSGKPLGRPPDWLGCSWEEFFVWIEDLFEAGMTWGNYGYGKGKWNYDHELSFFAVNDRAKTVDEIFRRAHYKNVGPMWSEKNQSKGNR